MAIGLFVDAATVSIPVGTDAVETTGFSVLDSGAALYVFADMGSPSADAAYAAAHPRTAFISANGRLFRLADLDVITPAMFGMSGVATDDQSVGMKAMCDHARRIGYITINGTPGETYTTKNAYELNGIRGLTFNGNGCSLMNIRGTSADIDMNIGNYVNPFPNNNAFLPNGCEPLTYLDGQGPLLNDFGHLITQTARGSTTLTMKTDATRPIPLRPGRCLIYSGFRFPGGGLPANPPTFEYNTIVSVAGNTVTLAEPTVHQYEEFAPETNSTSTDRYGPARCLSLERPDMPLEPTPSFRASIWPDYTIIRDVSLLKNPAWTGADYSAEFNGTTYLGGGRHVLAERCNFATNLGVGTTERLELVDCLVGRDLEIDKNIDELVCRNVHARRILFATGAKRVVLDSCQNTGVYDGSPSGGGISLGPIDYLEIKGGIYSGTALNSGNALFYNSDFATGHIKIGGDVTFIPNADADRFVYGGGLKGNPIVVSQNTIRVSRTVYDSYSWSQYLRPGAVFYDANRRPAFRVTRMPYCDGPGVTTPDVVNGDVFIDGEPLAAPMATSAELALPRYPFLELGDDVQLRGPNARRVSCVLGTGNLGTDFETVYSEYGQIIEPRKRDGRVIIDSTMQVLNANSGNFDFALSELQRIVSMDVEVFAAETGTLTLRYMNVGGGVIPLLVIDLSQMGYRRWELGNAAILLTGDAAVNFPVEITTRLRWEDTTAGNALGSRAAWRAEFSVQQYNIVRPF